MKRIEIDDEVYNFLLRKTSFIGENASNILRRLLNIDETTTTTGTIETSTGLTPIPSPVPDLPVESSPESFEPDPISEFLRSNHFRSSPDVTHRYLETLAWIFRDKRDQFERIRSITGRQRVYFAQSETEIANSGNATHPHRIPGTSWFALTNNDTSNKLRVLREVMSLFQYHVGVINRVVRAVEHGHEDGNNRFQI